MILIDLQNLKTPFEYFCYFFPDCLVTHIMEQINLYSHQLNISNPITVSTNDIRKYLGILIMSSVVTCHNFRYYWNPHVGNEIIIKTMTVNRFEAIRAVCYSLQ